MERRAPTGFGLVELMASLAIIGVLVALLLPALNRASSRARLTGCLNNVRQLGLGLQQFTSEHGFYPLEAGGELAGATYPTNLSSWTVAVESHLADGDSRRSINFLNRRVWLCPGVRSRGFLGQDFISYGYNAYGIGISSNAPGLGGHYGFTDPIRPGRQPVRVSEVIRPSGMMAIGDGFHGNGTRVFSGQGLLWRHDSYSGFLDSTPARVRHLGRANVVFSDGHAESPTLKSLFEDVGDSDLVRWNRDDLPHRELLGP